MDNSNPNDIVFDPCAGGGTHLLAAAETGRNFIGCEINTEYFNISRERLGLSENSCDAVNL